MSYCIKLSIDRSLSCKLKYYIYRSKNANDINTISKVKTLIPILVIDEEQYDTSNLIDNKYVVYDSKDKNKTLLGVIYNGPEPVSIPATEYEVLFNNNAFNEYTNSAIIQLNPLDIEYSGLIYYYSVIGVDTENNLITHLSQVKAELLLSDYKNEGTREIFSCDDYTGFPKDEWKSITIADWNTDIIFGDIQNPITYNKYGTPFVDKISIFNKDEIEVETRCAALFGHIVVRVPNIWRMNNKKYNYRKLKSFKIRNIYDDKYGDFSEPTYQNELIVSNEKMLVYRKNVTLEEDKEAPIPLTATDNNIMNVIRRNGIYYNAPVHKMYGCNKYNINEDENIAVFSESSVQDTINFNFSAEGGAIYNYTFYVQDVYGKYSEPCVLIIET